MATANKVYNISAKIDSKEAKKGRDNVVSYLDDIRKKSKNMGSSVDKDLKYDTRGSRKSLKSIEDGFDDITSSSRDSAKKVSRSLDNMKESAGKFGDKLGTVRKGITAVSTVAVGAGTAFAVYTKKVAENAVELDYLSSISGVGVERFQELAYGAKTVGVEQDKLSDIFKDSQEKMGDFIQTGGGPLADFFENIAPKVGVTADEFKNLTGPQVLQKYVNSLKDANVSQQDMTFYMEAIASDSMRLLPLLDNMGEKWDKLSSESKRFGNNLNEFEVKKLSEVNEGFNKMNGLIGGTMQGLIASFSSEINTAMENAAKNTQNIASNLVNVRDRLSEISELDLVQTQRRKADIAIELKRRQNESGIINAIKESYRIFADSESILAPDVSTLTGNSDAFKSTENLVKEQKEVNKQHEKNIKTKNKAIETQKQFNNFTEYSSLIIGEATESLKDNSKEIERNNTLQVFGVDSLKEYTKSIQKLGYETGLGFSKVSDIISEIQDNKLYDFYDNIGQKVRAYIKDNNLQVESNNRVSSSVDELTKKKESLISSINSEIEKLVKSNETFGMSEEEVVKYRIANGDLKDAIDMLGISGEEASRKILQLTKSMTMKEADATLLDEVKSLKNELTSMDLDGKELIDFNVMNEFGDQAEFASEKGKRALEDIKNIRYELERKAEAESFMERAKTDVELLTEELERLKNVEDLMSVEAFDKLSNEISDNIELAKIKADDFSNFMYETGKDIRSSFADAIGKGLDGDFESMFDSLQNTMRQKVAELLADQALNQLSNLFSGMFGGMGGGSGGFGSLLSGLFGGRSAGGYMSPNKPYIVGEKGPEVVYPNNPSSVQNAQNSGKSTNPNININIGSVGGNEKQVKESVAKIRKGIASSYEEAVRRGDR